MQTLHYRGVPRGHASSEWLGAVGGGNAGGVHEVLGAPRDTVQWPTVFARTDLLVGLAGLRERELPREGDDAAQFRIEALKPFQIEISEPLGGELALLDPA